MEEVDQLIGEPLESQIRMLRDSISYNEGSLKGAEYELRNVAPEYEWFAQHAAVKYRRKLVTLRQCLRLLKDQQMRIGTERAALTGEKR